MKTKLLTASALILCLALVLSACGALADKGTYALGKDSVTSIAGALGEERKMNGVSAETKNGVQTHTYEYLTDPDDPTQAANDVAVYFQYLLDHDDFLSMKAFNGLPYEGGVEMQFAKNSVDDGKIIILDIVYNEKGYTLTFTKGKGTLEEN